MDLFGICSPYFLTDVLVFLQVDLNCTSQKTKLFI